MDIGQLNPSRSAKTLSGHSWAPVSSPLHPLSPRLCFYLLLAPTSCLLANSVCLQTTARPAGSEPLRSFHPGEVSVEWRPDQDDQGHEEAKKTKRSAEPQATLLTAWVKNAPKLNLCYRYVQPAHPCLWRGRSMVRGTLPSACVSSLLPLCCSCWLTPECSGFWIQQLARTFGISLLPPSWSQILDLVPWSQRASTSFCKFLDFPTAIPYCSGCQLFPLPTSWVWTV